MPRWGIALENPLAASHLSFIIYHLAQRLIYHLAQRYKSFGPVTSSNESNSSLSIDSS